MDKLGLGRVADWGNYGDAVNMRAKRGCRGSMRIGHMGWGLGLMLYVVDFRWREATYPYVALWQDD